MPPALFFLRTLLAIQGFLFFHTNFTIVFSNSVKNATDILIKFHMLYFFIHSLYLWLHLVFVALCGLSLVVACGSCSPVAVRGASHCGGFSCCEAQALGVQAQ